MTFAEYRGQVKKVLATDYGIDIDTLDTSPLRDWFLRGETVSEAARLLAIKDGFPC